MPNHIIGLSKSQIKASLKEAYIEFGCWLYIPNQNLLLSFESQYCQRVAVL